MNKSVSHLYYLQRLLLINQSQQPLHYPLFYCFYCFCIVALSLHCILLVLYVLSVLCRSVSCICQLLLKNIYAMLCCVYSVVHSKVCSIFKFPSRFMCKDGFVCSELLQLGSSYCRLIVSTDER